MATEHQRNEETYSYLYFLLPDKIITGATGAVPQKVAPLSSASGACIGYTVVFILAQYPPAFVGDELFT
jgi:hypothetical protein